MTYEAKVRAIKHRVSREMFGERVGLPCLTISQCVIELGVVKSHTKEITMNSEVVYLDKLVEITDNSILFRWYYFPFGSKRVKDVAW